MLHLDDYRVNQDLAPAVGLDFPKLDIYCGRRRTL